MRNDFLTSIAEKIRSKSNNDVDSRLGVYLEVNPNLTAPSQCYDILECERVLITRYRCGSHNLNIEAGRLCKPIIPREERLCTCNTDIQSLRHCLFDCPLLQEMHEEYQFTTIQEAFNSPYIGKVLMRIEKILKVVYFPSFVQTKGAIFLVSTG